MIEFTTQQWQEVNRAKDEKSFTVKLVAGVGKKHGKINIQTHTHTHTVSLFNCGELVENKLKEIGISKVVSYVLKYVFDVSTNCSKSARLTARVVLGTLNGLNNTLNIFCNDFRFL